MTMKLFEDLSKNSHWKESVKSNTRENGLEVLLISQFTLDAFFKGAKPDFHKAMSGEEAENLFNSAVERARQLHPKGPDYIKTGKFGAMMEVSIVNDGPVTMIYDYPVTTVNRKGEEIKKINEQIEPNV